MRGGVKEIDRGRREGERRRERKEKKGMKGKRIEEKKRYEMRWAEIERRRVRMKGKRRRGNPLVLLTKKGNDATQRNGYQLDSLFDFFGEPLNFGQSWPIFRRDRYNC